MPGADLFDFSAYIGVGASGFGLAHGPGIDLRPELPRTTPDLIGIDLTHRIDVSDILHGGFSAAKGGQGGGPGGGGGGGGGGGYTPATFTAGAIGAYNIVIQFKGSNWNTGLEADFKSSAERLVSLIVGDVADVSVIMKGGIQAVDDILITAELKAIDGLNGILGQAGPTSVRTDGSLPATATMTFDVADAQAFHDMTFTAAPGMESNFFAVIVTHEMLHSVGFGSIWSRLPVVSGANFVGANAMQAYGELLGTNVATGVPIEQDGGSGTAGSHWDEDTFHGELMTGYINLSNYGGNTLPDPLSKLTVASLQDLGYVVSYAGQIDGYII